MNLKAFPAASWPSYPFQAGENRSRCGCGSVRDDGQQLCDEAESQTIESLCHATVAQWNAAIAMIREKITGEKCIGKNFRK